MDKNIFKDKIYSEIINGETLKNRFSTLRENTDYCGDGMALLDLYSYKRYDKKTQAELEEELILWERRVREELRHYFGEKESSPFFEFKISNSKHWSDFKNIGIKKIQENLTTLRSYIDRIDYLPFKTDIIDKKEHTLTSMHSKPYKIFISHASEDVVFVHELVKVLEFLGIKNSEDILCSSLDGYRIPIGEDFAKYILKQFYDYQLLVLIVHSPNYYASPYCLNEMGACWILNTDCYSFLVNDFDYADMKGVINNRKIAIKVDSNEARSRMNDLKNILIQKFNLISVDESRWETLRDEFLGNVNAANTK